MRLTIFIREECAGYWSEISELPGCFASGRTLTELRVALGEAIGLYLWEQPIDLGKTELVPGAITVDVAPPATPGVSRSVR